MDAFNCLNRTPLHLAARFGRQNAARLLVRHGADLEARWDTNEIALHFAVDEEPDRVVSILIDKGAYRFARGDRDTPPRCARSLGRCNLVELLQVPGAYRLILILLELVHEEMID